MSSTLLVDSSIWTQALRKNGDVVIKQRLFTLLEAGAAVWTDIIRLELWAGAKGEVERRQLRQFDRQVPRLPLTNEVWERAFRLVDRALAKGYHIPANDFLIYATALEYRIGIEHRDQHYDLLALLDPK